MGARCRHLGKGQFQGITRDHYLEVDLGKDVPTSGPLYLIGQGSIHDTESSLNVAITQGDRWHAKGMTIEVPDGNGGWIPAPAETNRGFPAGRKKTVVFDLTDVFKPGTPRKVRIRTNLEIYWDCIHVGGRRARRADSRSHSRCECGGLALSRIFGDRASGSECAGSRSAELQSDRIVRKQKWRDLIGYYTRYRRCEGTAFANRRSLRDREFRR